MGVANPISQKDNNDGPSHLGLVRPVWSRGTRRDRLSLHALPHEYAHQAVHLSSLLSLMSVHAARPAAM
jgi:hypothetical protein